VRLRKLDEKLEREVREWEGSKGEGGKAEGE
jgi:hypothetical protein